MSDIIYVLMEIGWDYNDEIFFQPEGGAGYPSSFYLNEDEAEKECQTRNLDSFKNLWATGEIKEHCHSIEDLLQYERDVEKKKLRKKALDKTCEKIFGKDFSELNDMLNDDESLESISKSDDDWKELMAFMRLTFWEVLTLERGSHGKSI